MSTLNKNGFLKKKIEYENMIKNRKTLFGLETEEKNKLLKMSDLIPMNYDEVKRNIFNYFYHFYCFIN